MKKLNVLLLLTMLLPLGMWAQKPMAKVTPNPLEVRGDSVIFTAEITVPKDKIMAQAGTYRIMPELGEFKFPEIRISSATLGQIAKNGIKTTIRCAMPFDEDMIGNDLEIEHEYEYAKGKNKEFKDMDDLAECCSTTGMLFMPNAQYELREIEYTPSSSVPLKVVAQLNFPLDISKFSPENFDREVETIGEYMRKYPDTRITVRGYASPEGPVQRNQTLATERANAARDWLMTALKKGGYKKELKGKTINVETTTEDWDGFVMLLERNNVSPEKQKKIKTILGSARSPEAKEREIMAIMGGEAAAEPYLRPLRRSTVILTSPTAMRSGMTSDQIDSVSTAYMAGNIPESALKDIYNQEEYLEAYQNTDAAEGKVSLLTGYYETYPGDMRVINDLGVMEVVDLNLIDLMGGDDALVGIGFDREMWDIDEEVDIDENKIKVKRKIKREDVDGIDYKMKFKAKLDDAEDKFEVSIENDADDYTAMNNLAVVHMTREDWALAGPLLMQANKMASTPANNYNLGLYYAETGNYAKALEHFAKARGVVDIEYNRGLAYLMNGDTKKAMNDFVVFTNNHPDIAIGHYIAAIAAARMNDLTTLNRHLKAAIAIDDRLSDVAAEDLEFHTYWDNELFEAAADDDPKD